MARKAARKANGKILGSSVPAAVAPTIKMTDPAAFKKLCSAVHNATADADEARAQIGGLISAAVEKRHLDKKAFAFYRVLNKMSDVKLATTRAHLLYYLEIGGIDERCERQGQLLADRPEIEQAGAEIVQFDRGEQANEVGEFEPELDQA